MSGTSLDGIDAVLTDFSNGGFRLIQHHHQPFPKGLKTTLTELIVANRPPDSLIAKTTSRKLASCYVDAINKLLKLTSDSREQIAKHDIVAIGNHGQTVYHRPPLSIQLDDGQYIADQAGITVVNQFRQADLAVGGQGAPLVPAFHREIFSAPDKSVAVVNIGGIANITAMSVTGGVSGFDTGPGNTLMDCWIQQARGLEFDRGGEWARGGNVILELLNAILDDPWFRRPPPKSTGREYFNLLWVEEMLGKYSLASDPQDIQATLCEVTAMSISKALKLSDDPLQQTYICGGGAHNEYLMERLQQLSPETSLIASEVQGIPADWVEACAFAWLARAHHNGIPGNIPAVTGATKPCVLGTAHTPRKPA
jgi:anhydro-N-acetylmuramic acid kinase